MQLAQLNIGKFKAGRDDPSMAYFFDNLDRVNALAERMPGFVWRLKDDSGNATNIPWAGDPAFAVNMSVWESVETLEAFVWKTVHAKVYERKAEFFEKSDQAHFVMWWVETGHIPTLAEANEKLNHYRSHGPSDAAFGWADLPAAKLWQQKRCA
jgi:hypothetical protein